MEPIKLPPEAASQLRAIQEFRYLCDENGMVIGRFMPCAQPFDVRKLEPPYSEEEIEQAKRRTVWYSTAEVLAHLENLGCGESDPPVNLFGVSPCAALHS